MSVPIWSHESGTIHVKQQHRIYQSLCLLHTSAVHHTIQYFAIRNAGRLPGDSLIATRCISIGFELPCSTIPSAASGRLRIVSTTISGGFSKHLFVQDSSRARGQPIRTPEYEVRYRISPESDPRGSSLQKVGVRSEGNQNPRPS